MRILVLDSIHGGKVIADHLTRHGHETDVIDVYRRQEGISPDLARHLTYDLIVAPVHLDPGYPLLRDIKAPVISHHAAVRWIIAGEIKGPVIEITGKQGKSTTAAALAFVMPGAGILQSSSGLVRYPEKEKMGRYSITPASLLTACSQIPASGWMIAEISLGFCGIGDLGILTSGVDYPVANGKKSAFAIKAGQSHLLSTVLVPQGVPLAHDGAVRITDLVEVTDGVACYQYGDISGSFSNPLLLLPGYQTPLLLAAGAALLLGIDPKGLSDFPALPGRMELTRDSGYTIIDNANSGTCFQTTIDAFRYGQEVAGEVAVTLIIGQESASVCENFATEEIITSILKVRPHMVILIPGDDRIKCDEIAQYCTEGDIGFTLARSGEEGTRLAKVQNNPLILLSVKRWK